MDWAGGNDPKPRELDEVPEKSKTVYIFQKDGCQTSKGNVKSLKLCVIYDTIH